MFCYCTCYTFIQQMGVEFNIWKIWTRKKLVAIQVIKFTAVKHYTTLTVLLFVTHIYLFISVDYTVVTAMRETKKHNAPRRTFQTTYNCLNTANYRSPFQHCNMQNKQTKKARWNPFIPANVTRLLWTTLTPYPVPYWAVLHRTTLQIASHPW